MKALCISGFRIGNSVNNITFIKDEWYDYKEGVIRKYATDHQKMSESVIDRLINQMGGGIQSLPIRIIGELNKLELDLKPLLDAQIRDKKIENLLNGDISENEE